MDAKDHPVISVLGDQRRFVVPVFQRQYGWSEEQLQPFWDDVVAKAEEALGGKPKFSHYMGALILAPGGDGFTIGATPRVQVIDGQQRLTTFQLFLVALRDVEAQLGGAELKAAINNYLYVPPMHGDIDAHAQFRLVPTPEDRPIFHLIVDGGLKAVRDKHPDWFFTYGSGKPIKKYLPASVRAVAFLRERIETYARYGTADEEAPSPPPTDEPADADRRRLQALLAAVLNHLKLVVITLSENDDAQVIFETLNSRGQQLLAMDLVRNNIFHRASGQGEEAEALFEAKWKPFDQENGFWKADSPRAKPRRPRIDHFLSHALTAQTGEETSLRELYAEYRAFTRPKGKPRFPTVEAELDALIAYRPVYRELELGGEGSDLARLGSKLDLWEVSTAYPLVFRIAQAEADLAVKAKLYGLIYSYLVRRAMCGLTPKNLNKTFARLTGVMITEGVNLATLAGAFAGLRGDTVRFPNDAELRAALVEKPMYYLIQRKERLADLLWDLECALRSKYAVQTPRPAFMSVEHIMPQIWTTNWPLPDGRMAPADEVTGADPVMLTTIQARAAALHTLGNLTLITVPGNSAASNKAFADKKPWLAQSLLALNQVITAHPAWDETAILTRSRELAELAVKVWPGPEAVL